jgi:hypothetical protein
MGVLIYSSIQILVPVDINNNLPKYLTTLLMFPACVNFLNPIEIKTITIKFI